MTRFGEISPLWQFLRFVQYLAKIRVYLGEILVKVAIFIVENGQKLKNNRAIWSHWRRSTIHEALLLFCFQVATFIVKFSNLL